MQQNLDSAFAALADPTRRAIVAQLSHGEAMISDLARPFALSQPAISRHIKVLEEAGLIRRRAEGTKRLCRLELPALSELEQWLSALRRALEANYGRLDLLLASLEPSETQKGPMTHDTQPENRRRNPRHRHAPLRGSTGGRLPRPRRS